MSSIHLGYESDGERRIDFAFLPLFATFDGATADMRPSPARCGCRSGVIFHARGPWLTGHLREGACCSLLRVLLLFCYIGADLEER